MPGIYTKLLDVDKVDLVVGPYGTNMIAPAMPIVIQHKMTFIGLLGLAVNSEFHYPNYFAMMPLGGPDPKEAFTEGFFEIAVAQNPKPKTVAIVGADAEFSQNAADGARDNAKALGLQIVYDKTYPPTTTDYSADRAGDQRDQSGHGGRRAPIRPIRSAWSAPWAKSALNAKLFGGGMVGLQNHLDQDQAGTASERHRQLRFLAARAENGIPGSRGRAQEVPGAGGEPRASIRSAIT